MRFDMNERERWRMIKKNYSDPISRRVSSRFVKNFDKFSTIESSRISANKQIFFGNEKSKNLICTNSN